MLAEDKVRILWESEGMVTQPVLGTFRKTSQRKAYLRGYMKDDLMFRQKNQYVKIFTYLLWEWKAFDGADVYHPVRKSEKRGGGREAVESWE